MSSRFINSRSYVAFFFSGTIVSAFERVHWDRNVKPYLFIFHRSLNKRVGLALLDCYLETSRLKKAAQLNEHNHNHSNILRHTLTDVVYFGYMVVIMTSLLEADTISLCSSFIDHCLSSNFFSKSKTTVISVTKFHLRQSYRFVGICVESLHLLGRTS
ncbi:unnamed protein product [Albugo candida]|uniref:Uncharacterized protein n=1 Tax=Albugo candida TaxID=65357 RepID=A0A024FVX8_9STRA|nr:unnamed protein product [Albugo candida]|eukprot:CCI11285.1 unnamed protein product [Albugo candida]